MFLFVFFSETIHFWLTPVCRCFLSWLKLISLSYGNGAGCCTSLIRSTGVDTCRLLHPHPRPRGMMQFCLGKGWRLQLLSDVFISLLSSCYISVSTSISVDFFFFFLPSVLSGICSLIRHSSFLSLPFFYSYHYFLSFRFKPCLKTDAHQRRRWTVSESTRVKEGLYVGDILFLPRVAPPHAWGQTVSASSWQIPSPTRRSN